MKKLDSKFLVTCGVLISLPIIFMLFMMLIRGCSSNVKSYAKYEEMMVSKTKSYAKTHKMLPKKNKSTIIKLDNLVDGGLKNSEKALNDSSCNGSVIIKNNAKLGKNFYNYIPYLECDNYKTDYIKDHLMKDVVTNGSGLYKVDDEYIFKGNKANNYLMFYGTSYRIIKIDADGNLKLIKEKNQDIASTWDNKYNIEKQGYTGVNNYSDSVILERLISDYKNEKFLTNDARVKILTHSLCVGKRSIDDVSAQITTECNEKLDEQIISLPSVIDYTMASYDANCKKIGDPSCTNYNYMLDFIDFTWTVDSVLDDNSLVYYIDSVGSELQEANTYKKYNWIIYVDSEELYQSGDGTKNNPYIID